MFLFAFFWFPYIINGYVDEERESCAAESVQLSGNVWGEVCPPGRSGALDVLYRSGRLIKTCHYKLNIVIFIYKKKIKKNKRSLILFFSIKFASIFMFYVHLKSNEINDGKQSSVWHCRSVIFQQRQILTKWADISLKFTVMSCRYLYMTNGS